MLVSSGIAMEIHYCMGKEAGVDFFASRSDKCGKCGMEEQNKAGCCKDDHHFFKLSDDHKNVSNDVSFNIGDVTIIPHFGLYQWQLASVNANVWINNNSPPVFTPPPARILHGVFRV